MNDFEREIINALKIRETDWQDVVKYPIGAAKKNCQSWAPRFDQILIHLDLAVLDYAVSRKLPKKYRIKL